MSRGAIGGAAGEAAPALVEASLSVRPTLAGAGTLAIALGSLPVGLVGFDFAFALGALLLAAVAGAPFAARRAARALDVVDAPAALRPIAGRGAPMMLRLAARHSTWSTAVAVLDVAGSARDASGAARVIVPRLAAGDALDAVLLARFHGRGRRDAIAIEFAVTAPFALFDVRRVLVRPCRVVVGARPSAALAPALARWNRSRAAADAAEALHPSRRGSLRDLPDGLRLARSSTPARELAWAATARTGRPIAYAREAAPTPQRIDVVLALDARGRARSADAAFEAAVRVTARTLHALLRSGAAPRLALSRQAAGEMAALHAAASTVVAGPRPRAWFDALADVRREAPRGDAAPSREVARAIVIVATSPHEVRAAQLAAAVAASPRGTSDVVLALVASDLECAVVDPAWASRERSRGAPR